MDMGPGPRARAQKLLGRSPGDACASRAISQQIIGNIYQIILLITSRIYSINVGFAFAFTFAFALAFALASALASALALSFASRRIARDSSRQ